MSSTPQRYQPDERLIDDPEALFRLYEVEGYSIRTIADEYAEVSRTRVGEALDEYGITSDEQTAVQSERGCDPPIIEDTSPNWSRVV